MVWVGHLCQRFQHLNEFIRREKTQFLSRELIPDRLELARFISKYLVADGAWSFLIHTINSRDQLIDGFYYFYRINGVNNNRMTVRNTHQCTLLAQHLRHVFQIKYYVGCEKMVAVEEPDMEICKSFLAGLYRVVFSDILLTCFKQLVQVFFQFAA